MRTKFKSRWIPALCALCAAMFVALPAVLPRAAHAAAKTDYIVLNNCDSTWDSTTSLDSKHQKQGLACVVAESTGESSNSQVLINQTLFASTQNDFKPEDAYFCLWFYIDDVAAVRDYLGHKYFAIELGSKPECDVDEYEFNLMKYADNGTIKSGEWTLLKLPFSEAQRTGNPDLSKLMRVRFLTRGEKRTMKLDMLSVQKKGFSGEVLCPVQYKDVMTDNAYEGATVDTVNFVESASARITGENIAFVSQNADMGFTNLRADTFGISAWIYAEDEIESNTTLTLGDGTNELVYQDGEGLARGWNFRVFDSSIRTQNAANFDYEHIVSFRLAIGNTASTTANLERVRVVNTNVAYNYYPYGYADEETGKTFSVDASAQERMLSTVLTAGIAGVSALGVGLAVTLVLYFRKKKS